MYVENRITNDEKKNLTWIFITNQTFNIINITYEYLILYIYYHQESFIEFLYTFHLSMEQSGEFQKIEKLL